MVVEFVRSPGDSLVVFVSEHESQGDVSLPAISYPMAIGRVPKTAGGVSFVAR